MRKGFVSAAMTCFIAIAGWQLLRFVPLTSYFMGLFGTYLISLSIENEARRYVALKQKFKSFEVKSLLAHWPGAKVTNIVDEKRSLWQLIRPHVVSDILLRNQPIAIRQ